MRPSRAGQNLTDPRLCAAIVDRLTFGGTIIETGTDSTGWPTPATRKLRQPAEPGGARGSHRTGRPAARPSVDQANGLAS
ncbi:hypothetical protein [Mycolicibacterium agri]|uniref:hypothetical protein n=1 Tax=Mycolicibacterium agri TaxID=36811 RepID=UPI0035310550